MTPCRPPLEQQIYHIQCCIPAREPLDGHHRFLGKSEGGQAHGQQPDLPVQVQLGLAGDEQRVAQRAGKETDEQQRCEDLRDLASGAEFLAKDQDKQRRPLECWIVAPEAVGSNPIFRPK